VPLLHISGGLFRLTIGDWVSHPEAIVGCVVLLALYYYAVVYLRPRVSDAGRVRRLQVVFFVLGVLSIYLATSTPLDDLSELLVSAHMAQHVILTMVVPPLVIAGVPGWLWEWLLRAFRLEGVARRILHPLMALGIFNTVLLMTHLPPTVRLQVENSWFHLAAHALLVVAGLVMWWPVLGPVSWLPRLSYPMQMAYLFVHSLIPSVLASFLTFSDRLVYPFYVQRVALWALFCGTPFSPVHDQQIGGLVMKLAPAPILWGFIAVAFFRWYQEFEARERGPSWEEVEAELRQLGLGGPQDLPSGR
jgi:putative membrane protein